MPERRPTALRRRLVAVLAAVVVVVTVGLATASTAVLRSQLVAQVDGELAQASRRLAQGPVVRPPAGEDGGEAPVGPPSPGDRPAVDDPADLPAGFGPGSAVVRYSDDGLVLAEHVTASLERLSLDDDQVAALESVSPDGRAHDVDVPGLGSFRAVHRTADDGGTTVVATSTATVDSTVRGYVLVQAALGVVGLVAAVGVGAWLVRRSLRPLDDVAAAAVRVSELELGQGAVAGIPRVPEPLTDERIEVGQVGAALNRMLENVETSLRARHDSEQQVRRFVADASHELRTPLATIRGYAELVRRAPDEAGGGTARPLDRIESEAVRMSGLVEDLLLLARLDAGRPLDRAPVDLAALAVDAVMDAHAASPDHDWALALPGDDDHHDGDRGHGEGGDGGAGADEPVVTGDEASLRQVLANLLANARTHTPAGTRVLVRLRERPDVVEIEVADDGPGIAPDLRPALFRRFTRGDASRHRAGGSTGLGLAIADAIVTAHRGTIDVRSATAGEGPAGTTGTTFTVRLPRGDAEAGAANDAPASA